MSLLIEAEEKHRQVTRKRQQRELYDLVKQVHMAMDWRDLLEADMRMLESQFIHSVADMEMLIEELPCNVVLRGALRMQLEGKQFPTGETSISHAFADWPPEKAGQAASLASSSRILNLTHLLVLSDHDWRDLDLPVGIKHRLRQWSLYPASRPLPSASKHSDRMVVSFNGKSYEVDRYCPHKGADLSSAGVNNGIITCPKHRWEFDIERDGQCIKGNQGCSLHAKLLW